MQARCPHCSNVFNTDRAGIQFCPNCGQQINVPDPAGAAAPPPPPPPGAPGGPGPGEFTRGPVPWEERAQRGLFGAFIENWTMVFMRPETFWSRMRPDGSLGDGLFFGWICFAVYGLLAIPFQLATSSFIRGLLESVISTANDLPPEVKRTLQQSLEKQSTGQAVGVIVGWMIAYPVILIILTALVHLMAMIFGASKNGFNATARVVAYAGAPWALAWVPCCGGIVAPIYSLVLVCWGLARAQETTGTRATFAVITPLLVLCCCFAGSLFLIGAAAGAAASQ